VKELSLLLDCVQGFAGFSNPSRQAIFYAWSYYPESDDHQLAHSKSFSWNAIQKNPTTCLGGDQLW
jgi:hypothetical protein